MNYPTPKTRGRLRGFRNLVVDGALWLWRVSRGGHVVLRGPAGERRYLSAAEVKGLTPDLFERGQRKLTGDGAVMPGDVARAIRGEAPRDQPPMLDMSASDLAYYEGAACRTA